MRKLLGPAFTLAAHLLFGVSFLIQSSEHKLSTKSRLRSLTSLKRCVRAIGSMHSFARRIYQMVTSWRDRLTDAGSSLTFDIRDDLDAFS
jgi:hypothetical protein